MKKTLAALLVLGCSPAFALDLAKVDVQLPALGVAPSELARAEVPAAPSALDAYLGGLRGEAAADPDRFVDEHTPAEVALAFGLAPSRFRVTDPDRIKNAAVRLTVNLSRQRLEVEAPELSAEFKISSGLPPRYSTPGSGKCYAPDFLEEMHYSSLYNKAPMPNSVFFNGNIAMHGTGAEELLGQPASHGCVRLSKADARTVYGLVKANGKARTVVCVAGVTPPGRAEPVSHPAR